MLTKRNSLPGDLRNSDWRFLLPHRTPKRALIIGVGRDVAPLAIADGLDFCCMAGQDMEWLAFLREASRAESGTDIALADIGRSGRLPFRNETFDLVVLGEGFGTMGEMLAEGKRILSSNGVMAIFSSSLKSKTSILCFSS